MAFSGWSQLIQVALLAQQTLVRYRRAGLNEHKRDGSNTLEDVTLEQASFDLLENLLEKLRTPVHYILGLNYIICSFIFVPLMYGIILALFLHGPG